MQVLLDNKKISNFSFVEEGMNLLGYESLNEIFFDVFEIKSNGLDFIKEKKGDFNGNPIIEVDICINKEIYKNVRFVLKENGQISINPNLLDYTKALIIEDKQLKRETSKPVNKKESITENIIPKPKKVIITENKKIKQEKSLLEKSKVEFFNSVKIDLIENLKEEIKAGIISDLLKNNIQSNFETLLEEGSTKFKLQKYFSNQNNKLRRELIEISEKIARRESLRFTESGGGTNAVQYANGGTMNGELIINGNLIINDQRYIKRVTFDIGDNIQQSFTFTHNLNTKDILVNVQDVSTGEIVIPYIKIIDPNTIFVEFSVIPTLNSYKLIIFG